MGFSFRSLYTEDDHLEQGGSANLLQRRAPEPLTRRGPQLTAKNKPSPPARPVLSGIPGPLPSAQAPPTRPILKQVKPAQSDEPIFYSLDSLEPETHRAEEAPSPRLDELEPLSAEPAATSKRPANFNSPDEQWRDAQIQLRAVFSVTDSFTLELITALTAKLPGVTSCMIQNSDHAFLATAEPEKVQSVEITQAPHAFEAFQQGCTLLGLDQVEGVLLRSTSGSATCFSCSSLSLMARHPDENLKPGLWEKLLLITQASAKLKPGI